MATPKLPAEARRQAILEAAIRLFSEKGFRGVTTRELAQAVGVTEPVLYQHFKTKQELYAAIVESKQQQVERKFSPLREGLTDFSRPDRDILCDLATSISRWYDEDPALSRLLLRSALEGHEFSDLFFQRNACAQFDVVKSYFEDRIRRGVFREMDPAIAGKAFIGMVAHHSMMRSLHRFDPEPKPVEETINQMVDLFLGGALKTAK